MLKYYKKYNSFKIVQPKTIVLFLSFIFLSIVLEAQNGPAGVGTNTASTNQNRFWLKADVGVFSDNGITPAVSGSSVTQWNDASGVGNNAAQATASRRPKYATNIVNGLPALRFFGTSYVTAGALPSIANNVGYTYLVVFRDTAFTAGNMNDGAGDYIIDRGSPSPEGNELCSFKITSTNKYGAQKRDGGGGGLGGPVSTSTVSNGSFRVADYRQTPGATKVYDLFIDGTLEATVSSADANYVPPCPQIGHHYQPANGGIKGYVAEVIIYNYNVNNAQMNILNSYLAAKYGLTLTANDKYTGDTPGNGNYDFEVAGVGKDVSGSNLAAASSISGGLEVAQSTVMEDNEYLLYGHPTGVNAMNFFDVGGMSAGPLKARWDRIWYFDWTHIGGTDETVNLTFDCSDAGMGSVVVAAPLTNYKLLYRAGLSGNWTEVMSASSLTGDRVTFSNVTYTTGDGYYTIGTLDANLSPLPIELLKFDVSKCAEELCIDWTTSSETINDFFVVEKTKNGIDFEPVGKVNGSGNSRAILNYKLVDKNPYNGVSYYRLSQTDFNGTKVSSKLKEIEFNSGTDFSFSIYPSPSNGESIGVSLILNENEKATITMYDMNGIEVLSQQVVAKNAGKNEFTLQPNQKLLSGIYSVNCTANQKVYSNRIIIK